MSLLEVTIKNSVLVRFNVSFLEDNQLLTDFKSLLRYLSNITVMLVSSAYIRG